jgi:TRAF3-interacting protein 1
VGKIREHVQALVQCTNPLGKAMDMLQEDIESMQKELQFWSRQGNAASN